MKYFTCLVAVLLACMTFTACCQYDDDDNVVTKDKSEVNGGNESVDGSESTNDGNSSSDNGGNTESVSTRSMIVGAWNVWEHNEYAGDYYVFNSDGSGYLTESEGTSTQRSETFTWTYNSTDDVIVMKNTENGGTEYFEIKSKSAEQIACSAWNDEKANPIKSDIILKKR